MPIKTYQELIDSFPDNNQRLIEASNIRDLVDSLTKYGVQASAVTGAISFVNNPTVMNQFTIPADWMSPGMEITSTEITFPLTDYWQLLIDFTLVADDPMDFGGVELFKNGTSQGIIGSPVGNSGQGPSTGDSFKVIGSRIVSFDQGDRLSYAFSKSTATNVAGTCVSGGVVATRFGPIYL